MEQRDRMKESKMALNGRLLLLCVGIMLVFNGITASGRNGLGWLGLADAVEEIRNSPQEETSETESAETPAEEPDAAGQQDNNETAADAPQEESDPAAGEQQEKTDTAEGTAPENTQDAAAVQVPDLNELVRRMDESGITIGDLRMLGILSLAIMFFEIIVGLLCAVFSNRVDKSKITLIAVIVLLAAEAVYVAVFFMKGALTLSILLNAVFLPLVLLWAATRLRKLAEADPERIYAVTPAKDRGFSIGGRKAEKKSDTAPEVPAKTSIRDKAMWNTQEEQQDTEDPDEQ